MKQMNPDEFVTAVSNGSIQIDEDINILRKAQDITYRDDIYNAIYDAQEGISTCIEEQTNKYGMQRISSLAWIAVITEEWGEAVAEYNKGNQDEFEHELLQTIACCVRLLTEVRREHEGLAEAEKDLYIRHS